MNLMKPVTDDQETIDLWDKIEKDVIAFLGPRPIRVRPDIYHKAVADLIAHTLKLQQCQTTS